MRLELETRRFYLGRDYSEALEAAGAVPVHLALIPKADYIAEAVADLDGILLPGSDSDVDPAYFGEEPHAKLKRVVPEKDETDLLVLAEAEKRNIPVLAICFGMQALNVSRGGSLIQDIDAQVKGGFKHEQGPPLDRNSHGITIEKGSVLAAMKSVAAQTGNVRVNSHHHQAINKPGKNLRAIARAKDGVIEGIQDMRKDRFNLGVQWHPEISWRSDELSREIFDVFVERCSR